MEIGLDMYDDGRDQDYMRWLECQKLGRDEDDEDRPRRRPMKRKSHRRKTRDRDQ